MADVLAKSNLFSYINPHQHSKGLSLIPESCAGSCSMRGFPVKLKSHALRLSSSLNSDFNGKRVVFKEKKGLPGRGNSSKVSIKARVGNKFLYFN